MTGADWLAIVAWIIAAGCWGFAVGHKFGYKEGKGDYEMGRTEQRNKDQSMAADLVKRGYPHGRRATSTHAPAIPKRDEVGSAAYRRLRDKKK